MEQYFIHYEKWEDYKEGMYKLEATNKDKLLIYAIQILSNPRLFDYILKIIKEQWPICYKVNMTNKQQNRRAWLGIQIKLMKLTI
jgi:hypothetical protein